MYKLSTFVRGGTPFIMRIILFCKTIRWRWWVSYALPHTCMQYILVIVYLPHLFLYRKTPIFHQGWIVDTLLKQASLCIGECVPPWPPLVPSTSRNRSWQRAATSSSSCWARYNTMPELLTSKLPVDANAMFPYLTSSPLVILTCQKFVWPPRE